MSILPLILRQSLTLVPRAPSLVSAQTRGYFGGRTFRIIDNNPTIVGGRPEIVAGTAAAANLADLTPIIVHPHISEVKDVFERRGINAGALISLPKNASPDWFQGISRVVGTSSIIIFPGNQERNLAPPHLTIKLLDHFWRGVAIADLNNEEVGQRFVCVLDPDTMRINLVSDLLGSRNAFSTPLTRLVLSSQKFEELQPYADCGEWDPSLEGLSLRLFERAFLPPDDGLI
jgi:hypothetical protein